MVHQVRIIIHGSCSMDDKTFCVPRDIFYGSHGHRKGSLDHRACYMGHSACAIFLGRWSLSSRTCSMVYEDSKMDRWMNQEVDVHEYAYVCRYVSKPRHNRVSLRKYILVHGRMSEPDLA